MGVMSTKFYSFEFCAERWPGLQGVGFASWLFLAPDGLKVLPHNWRGRHEVANAQAGSLLGLALDGIEVSIADYERRPQPYLKSDQPDDGQTEHDGPDSEDAASE